MGCEIQTVQLDTALFGDLIHTSELRIINFHEDNWTLRFGDYGHQYEAKGTTANMELLVSILSAMLIEEEQYQAALTGDANTPFLDTVQEEDHKTEAWLDV